MKQVRLGDVCTVVGGSTPKSNIPEYWNGDIKWITPAELASDSYFIYDTERHITDIAVKKTNLNLLPVGTVLLSCRAPIGKTAIVGSEMYCNQGFKNLVCSDNICNKYLYFFLKSKKNYLDALGRGATFKEISKSIVEDVKIPLPTMEEQHKIACTFEILQNDMEMLKRLADKLDTLVKSRFIEMFGDPVTNPMGISTKPMTDICQIVDGDRGKNYPKAEDLQLNGACLFLNAKNVTATGFRFDECMFITKDKDEAMRKGKLQRGDIILTTRGTIGNLAIYTDNVPYDNVRINSGMVILRLNGKEINDAFFVKQFRMQLKNIIQKIVSGSAQPQLPISTMNRIEILSPPIALQNQFAAFVAQVDKSKSVLQKLLEKQKLLRAALMQEYFG